MMTNPTNSNLRRLSVFARVALSLFLVYHLCVIVLLPNGGSLEARAVSPVLVPYANQLAMNNAWVFFSPGPSPNIYLEYDLEDSDMNTLDPEPRVFPQHKNSRWFSDSYFRSLYVMRYFTLDPIKQERFFAPWLCRQHPEAYAIVIRSVFENVPGIEKAWSGETFEDMLQRVDHERRRFTCIE